MKKYGNSDLAENSINSLILVTKLKGNQNFSIQNISKTYPMKIIEMLILLKTLFIHLYRLQS